MTPSPSPLIPMDVAALADRIQRLVDEGVRTILPARQAEFEQRFAQHGDMAYGALNTEVFAPVRAYLEQCGLVAKPRLPGGFQDSREWGNARETHQQRWMWSILIHGQRAIGAIAVGSHHDHSCFRLPRTPEILGLDATTRAGIVAELSRLKPEFAAAQPFRDWYRDHLARTASPPG